MNLQPVEPVTDTSFICCRCNQWSPCRSTLADLHGEPFRAYYCAPCASTIPPANLRADDEFLSTKPSMNAYATIEFISNTTSNGRAVRRALVELSTAAGQWLGSFTVLGFTTQELKGRAYMEADLNLANKGYTLQSLREAA